MSPRRRGAHERRRRKKCPTPSKHSWINRGEAVKALERSRVCDAVYRCPCGGWHLTSAPRRYGQIMEHRLAAEEAAQAAGLHLSRVVTRAIAVITYRMETGR